jgi:ABC-type nitrate/sulfonate/bicarbonate transport system substrate-binding protein
MAAISKFLADHSTAVVVLAELLILALAACTAKLNWEKLRRLLRAEPKAVAEVLSGSFGLVLAFYGVEHDRPGFSVTGIFVALVAFVLIERLETRNTRKEIVKQQIDIRDHFDRIDWYLKASETDKLTVAIFADLVIYLPLYVAHSLGYLQQESISIDYTPKPGDEKVAQAVASSEADIGLCDPCMCAREEFARPGESLRILAPLVTRNAVKAITKRELEIHARREKRGERISIATYPPPSTTFVMAAALRHELERYNEARGKEKPNVTLKPVDIDKVRDDLRNVLEENDIVMLWDPQLTIAKSWSEVTEFSFDSEGQGGSQQNPLMYSALVIPERLLKDKPTLGLRLFRALSRASFAIYLSAREPELLDRIVVAASNRISVQCDLKSLVEGMIRDKLFPIIQDPSQIHGTPEWREQLFRALQYRERARDSHAGALAKEKLVTVESADECRRLFCPPETFDSIVQRNN